jgi:hypothetical protein
MLGIILALWLCLLVAAIPYLAIEVWPSLGAQVVDLARGVLGDQVVAQVESTVLQTLDEFKQWEYGGAGVQPVTPGLSKAQPVPTAKPGVRTVTPQGTETAPTPSTQPSALPSAPVSIPIPTSTPTTPAWLPPQIAIANPSTLEGQWAPYLWDSTGWPVAYRAYFHPDPTRSYAYVVVVAFDLQHTQLHFVLGFDEPASTVQVLRSGRIPAQDLKVDSLLAAFNGGFKAQHGHFGVMTNGITLIPPIEGLGTVGISDSGQVQIGEWGKDFTPSPHWIAWRQNDPLIVQNGQINPHTADPDPKVWGYIVYGDTATYRSALGISPDGQILYYACGPSLTLPVLAHAMQATGVFQAMQLDINAFWVHFEAFQADGDQLKAVPLLDAMKGVGEHRFLTGSSRDFFYITTK